MSSSSSSSVTRIDPVEITNSSQYRYYLGLKTGEDTMMSRKKFLLTRDAYPRHGQFLSSSWFNPLIKSKNYKNDLWLAIVKVPQNDSGDIWKDTFRQLSATQGSSWKDLHCIECVSQYNWQSFYEDITDASKILRQQKDSRSKMIEVSLPCSRYGDSRRINFTVATSYSKQFENSNKDEETRLLRDPEDPKNSEVLMVTIQCPSFVISTQ